MIKSIVHDPLFLAQKPLPATPADAAVAQDLLDTLAAHADGCVGMAANMIGVSKRIIAVEAEEVIARKPAQELPNTALMAVISLSVWMNTRPFSRMFLAM